MLAKRVDQRSGDAAGRNVAFGLETLCRIAVLDEAACLAVLAALEQVRFLWRTRNGLFQLRPEAALAEDVTERVTKQIGTG